MRPILPLLAALALAAGPAVAQTPSQPAQQSLTPPTMHRSAPHKPRVRHRAHTGVTPIDHGPDTPAANRAYQGGGVVLQGAPGEPAPSPHATAPGLAPVGSVPPAH